MWGWYNIIGLPVFGYNLGLVGLGFWIWFFLGLGWGGLVVVGSLLVEDCGFAVFWVICAWCLVVL